MLVRDDGIVLRTRRSGETSRIVTFLGRHGGRIRLIVKGALSPRSPWRGLLEPGTHLDVVYYRREGRTLWFAREGSAASPPLPGDVSLEQMAARLAATELLDCVCYAGAPAPEMVEVAVEYLRCHRPADPLFAFLALELRLLGTLGVSPDFTRCAVCGEAFEGGVFRPDDGSVACAAHPAPVARAVEISAPTARTAASIGAAPFEALARVRAPARVRKELGRVLHWAYTLHVPGYHLPEALRLIS